MTSDRSDTKGRPAFHRLADIPIRDPFILPHGATGTYCLYAANDPRLSGAEGAGVMMYRSRDLVRWEPPILVFRVPEGGWADPTGDPWAPEVHEHRGRFTLFVTLHDPQRFFARSPQSLRDQPVRSTTIAVADTPEGPFRLLKPDGPITPEGFMTLDGTLFVDEGGKPWMVYAHEWIQLSDGTMEALPLKDDLSDADGEPIHLFKASEASWIGPTERPSGPDAFFITDGPQLFRTSEGILLMLWSSGENGDYVQTMARSETGLLQGPWKQLDPLVRADSGHGMIFRTFEGALMMVLHSPNRDARGRLFEMRDTGTGLEVVRPRPDLDGGNAGPAWQTKSS